MADHEVAQICPNGHIANSAMLLVPQHNKEYCEKCGEKTLAACPKCGGTIRGAGGIGRYDRPAHCRDCGAAYPWTERAMQAAIELFLDETGAQGEEAKAFEQSVHDVTRQTPAAQVASNRIVKALKKVGTATATSIREILVGVASEAAKKTLLGP